MKRIITNLILNFSLVVSVVLAATIPTAVSAIDVFQNCSGGGSGGGSAQSSASGSSICGAKTQDSFTNLMKNIINAILTVLGIIAVVMIIIGGIRYTTSNGDAQQTKAAKETILYAVVGVVVAILSYAIVNFVLARLGGKT